MGRIVYISRLANAGQRISLDAVKITCNHTDTWSGSLLPCSVLNVANSTVVPLGLFPPSALSSQPYLTGAVSVLGENLRDAIAGAMNATEAKGGVYVQLHDAYTALGPRLWPEGPPIWVPQGGGAPAVVFLADPSAVPRPILDLQNRQGLIAEVPLPPSAVWQAPEWCTATGAMRYSDLALINLPYPQQPDSWFSLVAAAGHTYACTR